MFVFASMAVKVFVKTTGGAAVGASGGRGRNAANAAAGGPLSKKPVQGERGSALPRVAVPRYEHASGDEDEADPSPVVV